MTMRAQTPSTHQVLTAVWCLLGILLLPASVTAQVRPPDISALSRYGMPAGTSAEVVVTGVNLHETLDVITDAAGLTVRIEERRDLGPAEITRDPASTGAPITDHGQRSEVRLRLTSRADATPGLHRLRLRTPLGATPAVPFAVGVWPELERGDAPGPLPTPVVVNGAIEADGESHAYVCDVPAGAELVVAVAAASLGSRLDSLLVLRGPDGVEVARNDDGPDGSRDSLIVHRAGRGGRYTVELSDATGRGTDRGHYRLTVGAVPVVTHVFPLGGKAGAAASIALTGANVPARVQLPDGQARVGQPDALRTVTLTSADGGGTPLTAGRVLHVGSHPEVLEDEVRTAALPGQPLAWPVTVNGRVAARADGASADHYGVDLQAGERLVMTVIAERAGSPLDSVIEVLSPDGTPVPHVLLRPVWETTVDLADRDSRGGGMRMLSTAGLRRGDYVMVDREVMRVRELPKSPDEDVSFITAMGRRVSYFGTSGESHALGRPIYKVEVHPPGSTHPPNGMPLFPVAYRNDDGGPFYGRDSTLSFEAPASGRFVIRVSDSRGMADERFAYRLTIAPPKPDFMLTLDTPAPNVPAGGRVPVAVTAFRFDGFDGPIDVRLDGLGPTLRSVRGTVLPGEYTVSLPLEADAAAAVAGVPFRVVGEARVGGRVLTRVADTSRALAVASIARPADVSVASVEPSLIELAPGERATVTVRVARHNGFTGRVPVNVRNLPFRTTIPDTGLNGILITEQQSERQFVIEADAAAGSLEQQVLVTARWEVNSAGSTEQAALPITLRVVDPNSTTVARTATLTAPSPRAASAAVSERAASERSAAQSGAVASAPAPSVPMGASAPAAVSQDAAGAASGAAPNRPWWGWVLLGRLHPTVVHFPIALILAGALFELLQVLRRRKVPSDVGTYCLALGLAGGLVAAGFGTLNAEHQTFTGASADLLERHRWAGWALVAIAAGALLAGRVLHSKGGARVGVAYAVLLAGSVGLVSAAGHFGGQLVYGEEYISGVLPWNQPDEREDASPLQTQRLDSPSSLPDATEEPGDPRREPEPGLDSTSRQATLPAASPRVTGSDQRPGDGVGAEPTRSTSAAPVTSTVSPSETTAADRPSEPASEAGTVAVAEAAAAPVASGVDFSRHVDPIFRETCVECHGPDKIRARLRMDSVAHLQKGGKSGPLFVAGDPDGSQLVRRVLGLDGEDRMPLDRDPLTDEQIEVLRRWVAEGARFGGGNPDTQQP